MWFFRKNGLNYPKRIFANCGCDSYSAFVIDSDGSIYKCWEEIAQIVVYCQYVWVEDALLIL